MDAVSTIGGLVVAVFAARLLVDGGTAVAKRFGIPSLVIGATVVAFGTSMPESTVNVHSAMGGNTDLALGNILGSKMFNIAFIIGENAGWDLENVPGSEGAGLAGSRDLFDFPAEQGFRGMETSSRETGCTATHLGC